MIVTLRVSVEVFAGWPIVQTRQYQTPSPSSGSVSSEICGPRWIGSAEVGRAAELRDGERRGAVRVPHEPRRRRRERLVVKRRRVLRRVAGADQHLAGLGPRGGAAHPVDRPDAPLVGRVAQQVVREDEDRPDRGHGGRDDVEGDGVVRELVLVADRARDRGPAQDHVGRGGRERVVGRREQGRRTGCRARDGPGHRVRAAGRPGTGLDRVAHLERPALEGPHAPVDRGAEPVGRRQHRGEQRPVRLDPLGEQGVRRELDLVAGGLLDGVQRSGTTPAGNAKEAPLPGALSVRAPNSGRRLDGEEPHRRRRRELAADLQRLHAPPVRARPQEGRHQGRLPREVCSGDRRERRARRQLDRVLDRSRDGRPLEPHRLRRDRPGGRGASGSAHGSRAPTTARTPPRASRRGWRGGGPRGRRRGARAAD